LFQNEEKQASSVKVTKLLSEKNRAKPFVRRDSFAISGQTPDSSELFSKGKQETSLQGISEAQEVISNIQKSKKIKTFCKQFKHFSFLKIQKIQKIII
jgi:hypothetical protein